MGTEQPPSGSQEPSFSPNIELVDMIRRMRKRLDELFAVASRLEHVAGIEHKQALEQLTEHLQQIGSALQRHLASVDTTHRDLRETTITELKAIVSPLDPLLTRIEQGVSALATANNLAHTVQQGSLDRLEQRVVELNTVIHRLDASTLVNSSLKDELSKSAKASRLEEVKDNITVQLSALTTQLSSINAQLSSITESNAHAATSTHTQLEHHHAINSTTLQRIEQKTESIHQNTIALSAIRSLPELKALAERIEGTIKKQSDIIEAKWTVGPIEGSIHARSVREMLLMYVSMISVGLIIILILHQIGLLPTPLWGNSDQQNNLINTVKAACEKQEQTMRDLKMTLASATDANELKASLEGLKLQLALLQCKPICRCPEGKPPLPVKRDPSPPIATQPVIPPTVSPCPQVAPSVHCNCLSKEQTTGTSTPASTPASTPPK